MWAVSLALLPVLAGYVMAALATMFLTVYTIREMESTPTMRAFAVLLALITLWSWADAGRMVATDLGTKFLFHSLGYVGIAFTPVAWVVFGLYYTNADKYLSRRVLAALSVPSLAALVLVVTGYRDLFYTAVGMDTVRGTALISLEAGPLYWVFSAYAYLLLLIGLVVLLRFALTSERLYRLQAVLLSSAAILPLLLNASFLAGLTPVPHVDLTPITFALSSLLIAVAVFYGQFVDVLPVAKTAIIESLDDGIIVTDDAERVLFANPAARAVLPGPEVIGTELSTTQLPIDTVDSGNSSEVTLETDAGTEWYIFRRVPFEQKRATSGNIYSLTNITERKELEAKLRQLQETSHDLMIAESMAELGEIVVSAAKEILELPITGLWQYDEEEEALQPVAMTSEGTERLGEQPVFEPGNSLAWQTFTGNETEVFEDVSEHEEVYRPDTPVTSELQVPLGQRGLLISGSTEYREFGDITLELIEVLANATELALIQTDRELQLRRRELELARENERLDQFTSVVSHDLRSPLNSADIFLERLTDDYDDPRLEKVVEAHDRTKELVDDLLALARQGEAVDDPEAVDLAEVARRAWESVVTEEASLEVAANCGTVRADESRLRQALENLYRNAIEHGEGEPTISVGAVPDGEGFYVADDGPGIPADERAQVFEHGYSRSADGTGFGLAIVDQIAEAHGWSVRATESADGGLRIEFTGVDRPD